MECIACSNTGLQYTLATVARRKTIDSRFVMVSRYTSMLKLLWWIAFHKSHELHVVFLKSMKTCIIVLWQNLKMKGKTTEVSFSKLLEFLRNITTEKISMYMALARY